MQQPSQDRIAQLAYELWQQRGCPQGSPDVDWEQACRMLESGSAPDNEVLSVPRPVPAQAGSDAIGNGVDDVPSLSNGADTTDRAESAAMAAAPRSIPPNSRGRGKGRSQRRSAI